MTRHKCNKDNCPAKGPKIKCCTCKSLCHLQCFGFQAGENIDGLDTVKITLQNGAIFTSFVSCMAFSCCAEQMSSTEQKKALKLPTVSRSTSSTRSSSKSSENESSYASEFKEIKSMLQSIKNATKSNTDEIAAMKSLSVPESNELENIKELLQTIKNATDANTAEIAEIKSLSTKTEASVKKVTEQSAATSQQTPQMGAAMSYVKAFRANALSKAATETPNSTRKRKRIESPITSKMNLPTPKIGTKSSASGLSVVPKPNRNNEDKPKFEKALYVSRMHPMTTCEEITAYITSNTTVTVPSRFSVHKMVKKDADLSSLKFVSFKIELNIDDLDVLDDANLWPEGVIVREFKPAPKNELGRHFPPLVDKNKYTAPDLMDTGSTA